ncbi:GntR family transcriptional regulator [Jannaschia sp. R86511]|uniref:GntR family transcriptional regulator n=1 Tax=Jannaschia sp. R86511 TaxID=3093853 RepID=UPI0036D30EF0
MSQDQLAAEVQGHHAPKYEELRAALADDINRRLRPHEALPSERDLMRAYGVSRMTVREALTRLVDDGLVYRVHGAGTFVADPATISKSLHLTSFSEDIRARDMTPGSRTVSAERVPVPEVVSTHLGLTTGQMVVHLERVRTADGVPMALEHVWLPAGLFVAIVDVDDLAAGSVYDRLVEAGAAPERAEQSIRAGVLPAREAALLDVAPGSPALVVSRTTYDLRGRAVERAESSYRADRYDFQLTVHRRRGT